ncbi:MAG: ATP-dependent helicase HrpB [Rhodobacteraceae bacterium]|nr:ATP-dependent helicase HrpB [Paracoccaceae bacterium]
MNSTLPIEPILSDLLAALRAKGCAVLQAPPGAGKTTRVPLYLFENQFCSGKILMLEPRRMAARAAAERLAEGLGEAVGQTVGYRVRGERKTSKATRIEVVTEGILTRMLQSDPELSGIDCVIFDEFHERSLHADLGLALCLEVREALREDLSILVMSATLDAGPVAELIGAPVITAEGRSYAVEARHLPRPLGKVRFEPAMARLIETALAETEGGVLAFLPGAGEIRRVAGMLKVPKGVEIMPLYGAMPFKEQRRVLAPLEGARKLVLATSIAETSLTIPDIRVVVDGGKARRARFDAGAGMQRLVTERVSRAEATQRAGRAGRVAAGTCFKLWSAGEEGAMRAFAPAEIEASDLSALVLELALWGVKDPSEMRFLTPPPTGAYQAAQGLLEALGALKNGLITAHGKALAALPVHPRLGQMLLRAGGKRAALLAAMLEARDPLSGAPVDVSLRLEALEDERRFRSRHPFRADANALKAIRREARRFEKPVRAKAEIGALLALAYPDRIGKLRAGGKGRYLLSGGKGAVMPEGEPMSSSLMVAADLDGDLREAKVRLAAPLTEADLRHWFGAQLQEVPVCEWSKRERMVVARQQLRLGAIALEDTRWANPPEAAVAEAVTDGIREMGLGCLNWTQPARLLCARVEWLRARGETLPAMDDTALMEALESWLAPYLGQCRTRSDLGKLDLVAPLKARLGWEGEQVLDRLVPANITAPTGTKLPVDYSVEPPLVSVRLQEMFGLTVHPTVGPDRLPVLIELLSPARRAVQTTADLPGFWATSYADVRKDMRGRYPRHPWPEDPAAAPPTRRVKPRGQ